MMMRAHPSGSEEKAVRALLEGIHRQVSAAIGRIDAALAEVRERERQLTNEAFRAQIRVEIQAWFKAHPDPRSLAELFGSREDE